MRKCEHLSGRVLWLVLDNLHIITILIRFEKVAFTIELLRKTIGKDQKVKALYRNRIIGKSVYMGNKIQNVIKIDSDQI